MHPCRLKIVVWRDSKEMEETMTSIDGGINTAGVHFYQGQVLLLLPLPTGITRWVTV